MNKFIGALLVLLSCGSQARDDALFLSIEDAMSSADARAKLNQDVKFVFGRGVKNSQSRLGTFTANRKTNAFNKSDIEACNWVFLSSMIALQKRALAEGGNAVVDIHSFYRKNAYESEEKFECHVGAIVAGVALRGTVVKLP